MAKISNLKKIVNEDFPQENRTLTTKLAFIINPFFDSIVNALNKNLTFNDNLNAQDTTITVTAPLSANPFFLKTDLKGICKGSSILQVTNLTNNNAVLTEAPFMEFDLVSNTEIKIKNITGLTSGNKYSIRIVLFA